MISPQDYDNQISSLFRNDVASPVIPNARALARTERNAASLPMCIFWASRSDLSCKEDEEDEEDSWEDSRKAKLGKDIQSFDFIR